MSVAVALSLAHAEEVFAETAHSEHEHNGDQCVEVVRNRGNERVEAVFTHVTTHGNCPRGNGGNNAYRCCGGVDDPRQLFMADAELVGYGTHDCTNSEAVEVVVNEYHDAQKSRHDGCHARALICFAAHSAYAREPPAMAMMTTNAPNNAKNKISAAFDEICSAIT